MFGRMRPALVALRRAREAVLRHLQEAFAHDRIGLDDFEQRVSAALNAKSETELAALTADIGPSAEPVNPPPSAAAGPRWRVRLSFQPNPWRLLGLAVLGWCAFCCLDFAAYMLTH